MDSQSRKHRARNEQIKIAKFTELNEDGSAFNVRVCGSRGVFYTINFSNSFGAQCSCFDFQRRKKNCKHIYFVIGIVAKEESLFANISETPSFTTTELISMSQHIKEQVNLLYGESTNKFNEEKKSEIVVERDDFCAICQMDLVPTEELWKCQTCSHVMHLNCLEGWWNVSPDYRDSCAYCRAKNYTQSKIQNQSGFPANDPWSIFSN